MKRIKKTEYKYGSVNIPDEAFEPKNQKVRITSWIDGDVLDALKAHAAKTGEGYQTLMNRLLRAAILDDETVESRLAKLEAAILGKKSGGRRAA